MKKLKNLEKIHPLNRKRAMSISEYLSENNMVRKIIIFGSSVTNRCRNHSDLDIYVELSRAPMETEKLVREFFDFPYDLWTNFTADDRLKTEITKKGVIVYEQNITG